ncbi:MAG: hypothetical protein NVS9B9_17610 [Ktedonobacteraceae bacterium]
MSHKFRHPTYQPTSPDSEESKMVRTLDKLALFEDWETSVVPRIKEMLRKGYTVTRMRKELAPLVQARILSIALAGDPRAKTTLAAAQDILDRDEGKALQRQAIAIKKYAELSKEEAKALAVQRMKEVGIIVEEEDEQTPEAPDQSGPTGSGSTS